MTGPPSIFAAKLSPALTRHLENISIDPLSRTDESRLQVRALPNIGQIELVSAADFHTHYDALYTAMFPRRAERERSDLIVSRLTAQARGDRRGLAPYRIVGVRDPQGEAVGAAQFSVLPLPGAARYAVPYLQYIYVRPQNRRQDMSEVLHTMVLAVAAADGAADGRTVPFTLFETEPPGHGDDVVSRAYAHERSQIHTNTGGMALMLRRPRDGKILSAHVQPGLEQADPPLTLVWVIRKSPSPGREYDVDALGRHLVAAYYQSLRDEGFPEANISLAEHMVEARCRDAVFHLMPLGDVSDADISDRP